MAMIQEDSGRALKAAFEFCDAMERHYTAKDDLKPVSRDLIGYLAHFLGWGGEHTDRYSIRFSGVETELERGYFWMNFAVYLRTEASPRMVGAFMFRNDEWSVHS